MTRAFVMWGLQLPERTAFHLYWMLVGTGYANTVFYWGGLLAENRALSFGDNQFGETSLAGVIGVAPAFVFAFVTMIAMLIIARHAFKAETRA
jgi:tetrahydromethanopterin S-methyltransferase subunit F